MKAKIIGILVCLMLMTAFLTTAQDVGNIPVKNESDENEPISFYDVEVPVWEVGYKWTYKIDRFILDFEYSGLGLYMDVKTDELSIEVTDDTGDYYNVSFEAGISGFFWTAFDLGDGLINISFELKSATIEGYMLFNKNDLGIKRINPKIYGTLDIDIKEQPYIKLPFKLHKEIVITIDLEIVLENPFPPIIKFPFNVSDCWGLPSDIIKLVGGTIESPLFEKIDDINRNFVNPILVLLNDTINGDTIARLLEFSNILKDILPIINITYILEKYLDIILEFTTPEIPQIICCFGKDMVTVPAGTFDCYNISLLSTNLANMYYDDTEVKNIVKVTGNLKDIFPSIPDVNIELISYET